MSVLCRNHHGSPWRAPVGVLAWVLVWAAAACTGPPQADELAEEPTGQASSAIHSSHTGSAPWTHVLTCYGGCADPYYNPSACNQPTSCGPIADGTWWYATERAAFHCGAKLKLERGDLCVVVDVQDNGPADWVEDNCNGTCGTPYIIDTSPLVAEYFGGGCGWSECFFVEVSQVPDDTPTGPAGCEVCECTAAEQESEDCGNCGSRSRTCQSDCQWGDWSDCAGAGPCVPQSTETEPCCDCGERSRSCGDDCTWTDWTACEGPDPDGGLTDCSTGLSPPCDTGTLRCVEGCVTCLSTRYEEPELCDGQDNDCNGQIDDGNPAELGSPPPAYAARLLDSVVPTELALGQQIAATAVFENAGSAVWPAGQTWLAAVDASGTVASALRAPEWPSSEVAQQTSADVLPGSSVTLSFQLQAPQLPTQVQEEFRLLAPDGAVVRCPGPGVLMDIEIRDGPPVEPAAPGEEPASAIVGECACVFVGVRRHADSTTSWLALPFVGMALRRRARRRR